MIRAGKYELGGRTVEVNNLVGGRQEIRIGDARVLFNENGYTIDDKSLDAAGEPIPQSEVKVAPEKTFGADMKAQATKAFGEPVVDERRTARDR